MDLQVAWEIVEVWEGRDFSGKQFSVALVADIT